MHNHDEKSGNGMMWMMVVCCALPLVFVFLGGGALFAGGSAIFAGGYFWPVLIGIGALAWGWMMFRGHRRNKTDGSKKDDHPCCH